MDIGLYNLKYPARKAMQSVLPLVRSLDPNWVSYAMLPVGAAITYVVAQMLLYPAQTPLALWAIGLTLLRMFLGTLDGLIAETFKKGSAKGEIINRLAPEICDIMLLGAFALYSPDTALAILALLMAWLTTFSGLVGLSVKGKVQSSGPAGQTDRLFAFMVFCFMHYIHLGQQPMRLFLLWVIIGSIMTNFLRLKRVFEHCEKLDRNA